MRSLLAAVSLLSIASSQTTQNILANQISSACLTNLQPSTLPDLLPAIQAAAASSNPPITNFSLAFQALVLPPLPNWLSNLSFQYQSQLSAFAATMAQIKSDAIKNHTELCSTQPSDERCGPATALTTAISLDISATIEAGGTGVVMTPVGTHAASTTAAQTTLSSAKSLGCSNIAPSLGRLLGLVGVVLVLILL